MKIKIGHGAYTGANKLAIVGSKAAAVRELRNRGFFRDHARNIVNKVCAGTGYACDYVTNTFELVEVSLFSEVM